MRLSLVQKMRLNESIEKINMANQLNLEQKSMKKKDSINGEEIINMKKKRKSITTNLFKSSRRRRKNIKHKKNRSLNLTIFKNHSQKSKHR
jgi:hypothetical protein